VGSKEGEIKRQLSSPGMQRPAQGATSAWRGAGVASAVGVVEVLGSKEGEIKRQVSSPGMQRPVQGATSAWRGVGTPVRQRPVQFKPLPPVGAAFDPPPRPTMKSAGIRQKTQLQLAQSASAGTLESQMKLTPTTPTSPKIAFRKDDSERTPRTWRPTMTSPRLVSAAQNRSGSKTSSPVRTPRSTQHRSGSKTSSPMRTPRFSQDFICFAERGNYGITIKNLMTRRQGWMNALPENCKTTERNDFYSINFLWSCWRCMTYLDVMARQQQGGAKGGRMLRIHNHFEGVGALDNKDALCEAMVAMYAGQGFLAWDVLPLTFVITDSDGTQGATYAEFLEAFNSIQKDSGQRMWIVKPVHTNRGVGIHMFDKEGQIRKHLDNSFAKAPRNRCSWVVQKYIENPLLYDERKFDIRAFCLVTQDPGGGAVRAFFYRHAYVRTTSKKFTMDNVDRFVYLNNDAVQCNSKEYGLQEAANKVSLAGLQDHLKRTRPQDGVDVQRDFVSKFKALMADAVRATVHKLNPRQIDNCFEVFGFDFMIDENYRVYLIEVNTQPCLETPCKLLKDIIPKMVNQALELTVERICKPAAVRPPITEAAAATDWEHIYCSTDEGANLVDAVWLSKGAVVIGIASSEEHVVQAADITDGGSHPHSSDDADASKEQGPESTDASPR